MRVSRLPDRRAARGDGKKRLDAPLRFRSRSRGADVLARAAPAYPADPDPLLDARRGGRLALQLCQGQSLADMDAYALVFRLRLALARAACAPHQIIAPLIEMSWPEM